MRHYIQNTVVVKLLRVLIHCEQFITIGGCIYRYVTIRLVYSSSALVYDLL